ncbi:MAG: OmpA family protein [Hyphomicrobiaceae bacterium]|nr:OmpA family protein [Hyphomicrobiaceae bacterium]
MTVKRSTIGLAGASLVAWVCAGTGPSAVVLAQVADPVPQADSQLVEADPAEALAHARRLADAGRDQEAQRRLERLVAAHPNSPEARLARRELARYYSATLGDDTRSGAADAASVESHRPDAAAAIPAFRAETGDQLESLLAQMDGHASAQLGSDAGDRVFFSAGSADLGGRARTVIARQARWLTERRAVGVLVAGHADEPGTDEDNQVLAARRAEAVRVRLMEEGIPATRISAVALGRRDRIALCQDSPCAAQNRRAVTVVLRAPPSNRASPPGNSGSPPAESGSRTVPFGW